MLRLRINPQKNCNHVRIRFSLRQIVMMNTSHDLLARCLVAEEHPHLQEEKEFQDARAAVDASEVLQKELSEARDFLSRHPVLLDTSEMPRDVKERIREALQAHQQEIRPAGQEILGPWQVRRQFAWAAVLVLLLAGMAVLSSNLMEMQHRRERQLALRQMRPEDAFRSEVARLVRHRIALQERSPDSSRLISWLGAQGVEGVHAPAELMEKPTLGCAQFETPFGKLGVVCFDVDGKVLHLFVACAETMGVEEPRAPEWFQLQERSAMEWSDEENLYLLIPHEVDTQLPQIFL